MQKVCLDLHDFSAVNNRLDLLFKLKDHFSNFKVSLFTVAVDEKKDWGAYLVRQDFLGKIIANKDWMQIVPHALNHNGSEVQNMDYLGFKELLRNIEVALFSDGLIFSPGFCPPHWRWNEDIVKVLDEYGWWGAVDRDKEMPRPKKFYQYNYLLNEPFPLDTDLKLHGHIYGTKNDLGRCFDNLMRLDSSTEFVFATDCLEGIE